MNNTNKNNRFGGAVGIIIGIIVLIGIIGGVSFGYAYNSGKEMQETQTKLWAEAFTFFSQKQPEAAYLKLIEARSTFCDSLDLYRELATGTYLTKAEVNEAIVLICQSEAYDNLFKLESAGNWITNAKHEIENVDDSETRLALANFISRAEAAEKFCARYKACLTEENVSNEKYQLLVKDSLKVANEALEANDYDYTIFEIRFLIACGKSFNEPILISEARRQLFDLTQVFGEDEKTKLLWSLLRQ